MNVFSRVKNFFAGKPKAAQPAAITNRDGLSFTRFYGQKFQGGLPFPHPTLVLDSEGIRQQVRSLSHNSLHLRALLERDVDTVIAQGLNLSPEPKYSILGISPEAAEEWTSDVKSRFELWAMDQKASRSSRYNFFQAQRLIVTGRQNWEFSAPRMGN